MSYICYPDQAMKFFEDRKAKERKHLHLRHRRSVSEVA